VSKREGEIAEKGQKEIKPQRLAATITMEGDGKKKPIGRRSQEGTITGNGKIRCLWGIKTVEVIE